VLVSGGSAANITALACARESLLGPMSDRVVAYVADQTIRPLPAQHGCSDSDPISSACYRPTRITGCASTRCAGRSRLTAAPGCSR
jgi:hypothetical protein